MIEITKLTSQALQKLLDDKYVHSVTAFCDPLDNPTKRVRITQFNKGVDYRVTISKPNYDERQHLKRCKKNGVRTARFILA